MAVILRFPLVPRSDLTPGRRARAFSACDPAHGGDASHWWYEGIAGASFFPPLFSQLRLTPGPGVTRAKGRRLPFPSFVLLISKTMQKEDEFMKIEEAVRKIKSQLDAHGGDRQKAVAALWNELDLSDEDRKELAIQALARLVALEGRRTGLKLHL